jgi:hypothetical protein
VDGDGELDLFVAGRSVPGNYPVPATSRFFRNDRGTFSINEKLSKPFEGVGLVNSAVFTDLDGDGRPELALACEWDSIRVFRFSGGEVTEITTRLGLDRVKGWWQAVASGDFDGDGRMDLVAANWGRNHRYARFASEPVRIYFADLDGDGVTECFETYRDPTLGEYVPAQHWDSLAFRFPFLQRRIHSFAEFSSKSVEEIFGEQLNGFRQLSANFWESTVLLNRGDRFEIVPLPIEAQLAPAFGVSVADFDGDGVEDIFLAQNFSGTDSDTSRLVAGRGLLLLGNGSGRFRAVSAGESGIAVYGDARGVASGDFDHDGRVDLCVGQNSAQTKLFHNESARPGVRVRLHGSAENASGIGALLRAVFADGSLGAANEIHAGSGWLSRDSAAMVLSGRAKSVWIRWPGGAEMTVAVPAGAKSVTIDRSGKISTP